MYGFFLINFYETFPLQFRLMSPFLFFLSGDFYLVGGSVDKHYYNLISTWQPNFIIFISWFVVFLITLIYGCVIFIDGRVNYQYLLLSRKGINRFKVFYYWVELITFPMLTNIILTGSCNYYTEEDSIKIVNCYDKKHWTWMTKDADGQTAKTVIYTLAFTTAAVAIFYNLGLISHIYSEHVSSANHEAFLTKKETEFCLGLSSTWLTRYFFMFSNYRSGVQRMYWG